MTALRGRIVTESGQSIEFGKKVKIFFVQDVLKPVSKMKGVTHLQVAVPEPFLFAVL